MLKNKMPKKEYNSEEFSNNFSEIYITRKFRNDIQEIYGNFSRKDKEYPSLGLTIEGSPIYIACKKFPADIISRTAHTDRVNADHPSFRSFWNKVLREFEGKCRKSFVHIHPMGLPRLSRVDIDNFEKVRKNPSSPNTYGPNLPLPVILINLKRDQQLEILGFWVNNNKAHKAEVVTIDNDDPMVKRAWRKAEPMPYFSKEADYVKYINKVVDNDWQIKLGVKKGGEDKAILARKGNFRCILKFGGKNYLGLKNKFLDDNEIPLVEYIKWQKLFENIIEKKYGAEFSEENMEKSDITEKEKELNNVDRISTLQRLISQLISILDLIKKSNQEKEKSEGTDETLSVQAQP